MNKEIIFSMNTAFRGEFNIHGYSYGRGIRQRVLLDLCVEMNTSSYICAHFWHRDWQRLKHRGMW